MVAGRWACGKWALRVRDPARTRGGDPSYPGASSPSQDIYGIGFITADKIAQNLGIDRNSLIRSNAGLIYVLNQLAEDGHVYYPEANLVRKPKEILDVDEEIIIQAISGLSKEGEIFLEDLDPEGNHRAVYLAPFYVAETGIAQRLIDLKESPPNIRPIHPEKAIENGSKRS